MLTEAKIQTIQGEVAIDATLFQPSESYLMNTEEMENALAPFKFKGVGWYIGREICPHEGRTYDDSILVLPYTGLAVDGPKYLVCVYHHHNAGQAFSWIANAPTHLDERGK